MAFYTKPHNLKYTDMAIWIDQNAYKEDCDDQQMYEYLYHIMSMLAFTGKYFKTFEEYDEFSLFAATTIFMRYRDDRPTDNKGNEIKPINSVLNYAKRVAIPLKLQFQQQYAPSALSLDAEVGEANNTSVHNMIMDSTDAFNISNFRLYLYSIPNTVRAFLSKIPYKPDTMEWYNIYISCLLTLLNSITLPQATIDELKAAQEAGEAIRPELIDKLYKDARSSGVTLYHLPNTMQDYIRVLTNEIRHIICTDLSQIIHEYAPIGGSDKYVSVADIDRNPYYF